MKYGMPPTGLTEVHEEFVVTQSQGNRLCKEQGTLGFLLCRNVQFSEIFVLEMG